VIDKPPRWLSSCLRDGNQSLPDPMNSEEKWRFFKMLCDIGFKEIEVSFPSASQTDFDFTRRLIETPGAVPDDVWVQVLSQCREPLIRRTVEAVRGAKNAIIHIYLATSPCFRNVVFNYSEDESLKVAVECTKLVRSLTKDDPTQAGTNWQFEFSPETFSDSSPEFVVRLCDAVMEAWGPSGKDHDKIIFNLPATVEMSTPNIYADQIEWFSRHLKNRELAQISLHCHNDRDCATAATELGVMAGADRVEGCLFGNGERTGNVDLLTVALNLYSQGISPGLDFSNLNHIIQVYEECTKLPVHARAPYSGSLVVCAFSGSHQDAISKGFADRKRRNLGPEDPWQMPYLPIDPEDIGRTYEAIIRVNSQSGKGGAAWIILRKLHLDLPRGLQIAFSAVVQKHTDAVGRELKPDELINLFETTYFLRQNPRFNLVDYSIVPDRSQSPAPPAPGRTQDTRQLMRVFKGVVSIDGKEVELTGRGNGPISSLAAALRDIGIELEVQDYKEHAIGEGSNVKAAAYIECKVPNTTQTIWGVGIDRDVVQSSLVALLSAASNYAASNPSSPILKPIATRPSATSLSPSSAANGTTNGGARDAAQGAANVVAALEEKANGM
jgi:2-isopropylmalate synthase